MAETVKKATASGKARTKTGTATAATITAAKRATRAKATIVSHEEIAQLAHRYWQERGHGHGSHEDDWLRAERKLIGKAS